MDSIPNTSVNRSPLEPSFDELKRWFQWVEEFTFKYFKELKTSPALAPAPRVPLKESLLQTPGEGFEAALQDALSLILNSGIDTASGRYFGYIPGGGVPLGAFADFIAAVTNRYAGMYFAAPGAVEIENAVIRTFIQLFEFPDTAWGTLTSGGSIANLSAILAARQTRIRQEWSQSTIYFTEQSHNSIQKALKIAGLDPALFRGVPVDSECRMDMARLKEAILRDLEQGLKPWMVISALGTTNTGSVDPLEPLLKIRDEFKIWLHVDAAYGGFFRLSSSKRALFQGIREVDSLILDPHKGLFMPYGSGAVLVRDGEHLRQAFSSDAAYLADLASAPDRSPADYSPELTRHFRGLRIYLSLKAYGIQPFQEMLDEKLHLAQWAYQELRKIPELEFACEPELSLVVFRVRGQNELTQRLLKEVLSRARVHLSSTRLRGQVYLRMCVLSFRSHLAEVKECIFEIQQALLLLKDEIS